MQTSLVTFLHEGRTFDLATGAWIVDTPVAKLLREIEDLAAVHGLHLSRWQSSRAKWIVKIRYALHYGTRPMHFRHLYCPVCTVELTHREGKSPRCQAYRKLLTILSYLHSMGEVQ